MKVVETDLFGDPVDTLYVKGSGSDLVSDDRGRLRAGPARSSDRAGAARRALSDSEMAQQLRLACTREAPAPSVEAILHAILPARYVDHTHADAVLTMTNTPNGRKHVEELLRRRRRRRRLRDAGIRAGEAVREGLSGPGDRAHDRHGADEPRRVLVRRDRAPVVRADDRAGATGRGLPRRARCRAAAHVAVARRCRTRVAVEIAELRKQLSMVAGAPLIVSTTATPRTAAFLARDDLSDVASTRPDDPGSRDPDQARSDGRHATSRRMRRDYEQYFAAQSPAEPERADDAGPGAARRVRPSSSAS